MKASYVAVASTQILYTSVEWNHCLPGALRRAESLAVASRISCKQFPVHLILVGGRYIECKCTMRQLTKKAYPRDLIQRISRLLTDANQPCSIHLNRDVVIGRSVGLPAGVFDASHDVGMDSISFKNVNPFTNAFNYGCI